MVICHLYGVHDDDPEKKIGPFHFSCMSEFFWTRGVHHMKKEKNMLGNTFFAVRLGTFEFFQYILTFCTLMLVSRNFEMSKHGILPTKECTRK